jgi:hypothetical protein
MIDEDKANDKQQMKVPFNICSLSAIINYCRQAFRLGHGAVSLGLQQERTKHHCPTLG